MASINSNIYPCNGYFFVDSEGVRHVAGDFEGLFNKLVEYRVQRRLDTSPAALMILKKQLTEFLCVNNPGLCGQGMPAEQPKISENASLDGKVTGWLAFTFRKSGEGGLSYIRDEEVRARVEVCAKCPQQADLGKSCVTCSSVIDNISGILQRGKKLGQESLRACRALGTDTRVSVLLERRPMGYPFLPANCWTR